MSMKRIFEQRCRCGKLVQREDSPTLNKIPAGIGAYRPATCECGRKVELQPVSVLTPSTWLTRFGK